MNIEINLIVMGALVIVFFGFGFLLGMSFIMANIKVILKKFMEVIEEKGL